ncbi:hypothetical protein FN976_27850 [Caenimonas sedimenti]|uniref:STAS/SEC14 domain-containing protein n=2 Tax=Caenimonas sedimenti TaxID=2596921 RepID=A0A562ZEN9_9BURK|nr:hypothetical protein FN976_27850 [Caenimonas sedimenti]
MQQHARQHDGAQQQWLGPRAADPFKIETEHAGGCVFARVSGLLSIDKFISTLHILGIESEGWPEEVMLIDLRGLVTVYPRADLLHIGQEIACSFIHMRRLALLVLPERLTRISERSARRTGMDMSVFDSEVKALGWLSLEAGA